jgi:hypothetical protein
MLFRFEFKGVTLAMLIVGDFSLDTFKRDIIIEIKNKELEQISSLHPAYMLL